MTRKKKNILVGLSCFILLLIMTTVGAGFYMLDFSLKPDSKIQNKDSISFQYMFQEYPFLESWVDSLNLEGALKDTTLVNHEGKTLHGYYVRAPFETDKTAVIVHGYTDNAIRMLMIGYLYSHDLQYNILLPDLQYHGRSEGEAIQMGWKDRLDVLEWMQLANALYGGDTRMVIHGISMGAATTMMVSGEPQPSFVKCFVEDCGYTSVWDQFKKELKEQFGLPAFPLMHTASLLCKMKYGWDFREASALHQVAKCQLPMLFIHGDNDTYVPTWMVHPLYDIKPEPKALWIAPGSAHACSYLDHREEYTLRVKDFTSKYINE